MGIFIFRYDQLTDFNGERMRVFFFLPHIHTEAESDLRWMAFGFLLPVGGRGSVLLDVPVAFEVFLLQFSFLRCEVLHRMF